ncbi:MAG: ATP cone domain-containing protein, partial [Spirochaetaceae bacterium]
MAQLTVHKRDGKQVPFEASRIAAAVAKAYDAAGVSKEENRFDEVVDAIV